MHLTAIPDRMNCMLCLSEHTTRNHSTRFIRIMAVSLYRVVALSASQQCKHCPELHAA